MHYTANKMRMREERGSKDERRGERQEDRNDGMRCDFVSRNGYLWSLMISCM